LDKAGRSYWDGVWATGEAPAAHDPRDRRILNYPMLQIDAFMRPSLESAAANGGRQLMEIGCARSQWLPYFAREFGFAVTGLDYSERGCEQEREVLAKAGVTGEVVCADLFDAPAALRDRFDVLWTNGVLEHFDDTAGTLRAFASFVKPGGLLISLIPNMRGAVGAIERVLGPSTYRIHVPLSLQQLTQSHVLAGLNVQRCEYVMSNNFGVLAVSPSERFYPLRVLVMRVLRRLSLLVWMFERRFGQLPVKPLLSPYLICIATKPA
jgi:SAM-dependent methyltransferase